MADPLAPSRSRRVVTFDVYTRKVRSGSPPEGGLLDGASKGDAGWEFARELRFVKARYNKGPNAGSASLQLVPVDAEVRAIEDALPELWSDDQVRVVMQPTSQVSPGAAAGDPDSASDEPTGVVVFEGVMQRTDFNIARTEKSDVERCGVTAIPMPVIDNRTAEHLVRGRWVQDPGEAAGTPWLVDGPDVPAIFNRKGQPNMMPDNLVTADAGDLVLEGNLFTFDGDHRAESWTVGKAIKALLVQWLFGEEGSPLKRSATLEWATYQGLTEAATGERWEGLDTKLPEVDVHGLGVFEAIDRVCRAGGFEMALTPPMGRVAVDEEAAAPDRLYQIRIWRRGAGRNNYIRLMKRGTFHGTDAATTLTQNNVKTLQGMRDSAKVRNHIFAIGRTLIEATVELKPLWSPDDVDGTEVTAQHQQNIDGVEGNTYHQRHVQKGKDFDQYGHVGRLWGRDCTGQFEAEGLGYDTPAAYVHDANGVDFLDLLGIDGMDPVTADRTAHGVTDPIRWTRRPRPARPLNRPNIDTLSRPYILEVSEDSGATWSYVPGGYSVQSDRFAIMLTAENLALINADWFAKDRAKPIPAESWWALILSGALRFRLTCRIPADHAARHDAPRQTSSSTLYDRAQLITSSIEQTWQSPSSILGNGSWAKLDDTGSFGTSAVGADRMPELQDHAERVRDAAEVLRVTMSGDTWFVDPSLLQVGDRIRGILGRNFSFQINGPGSEARYPSVVNVTLTGYPKKGQGLAFALEDEAMRKGVV